MPLSSSQRQTLLDLVGEKGEVRFDNVSFSYGKNKPVIDGLSLTVKPGEQLTLTLTPVRQPPIIGTVVDSAGQPLSGIVVKMMEFESLRPFRVRRLLLRLPSGSTFLPVRSAISSRSFVRFQWKGYRIPGTVLSQTLRLYWYFSARPVKVLDFSWLQFSFFCVVLAVLAPVSTLSRC